MMNMLVLHHRMYLTRDTHSNRAEASIIGEVGDITMLERRRSSKDLMLQ